MKPINSHSLRRANSNSLTLHFKIDGLSILSLQNLNFLLFCHRKANKAKQGEGRIKSDQNCKVLVTGPFSCGKHAMLIGKQAQEKLRNF